MYTTLNSPDHQARSWRHWIWDWNGTLLDDTHICVQVLNELMRDAGKDPISAETYRQTFGFPVIEFYRQLGFPADQAAFEEVSHRFISRYAEQAVACPLQPGVSDLLTRLQARGVSQSVLSAAKQDTLEILVREYGLHGFFDHLIGATDIFAHGKEDAGRVLLAKLPWKPEEIVLVGDTLHDFEVAQAMGTDCVLVAHGHHSRERLETCGVKVAGDLAELERLFFTK